MSSKSDIFFFRYTPITTPRFSTLHSMITVLLPPQQYAYRRNGGQKKGRNVKCTKSTYCSHQVSLKNLSTWSRNIDIMVIKFVNYIRAGGSVETCFILTHVSAIMQNHSLTETTSFTWTQWTLLLSTRQIAKDKSLTLATSYHVTTDVPALTRSRTHKLAFHLTL